MNKKIVLQRVNHILINDHINRLKNLLWEQSNVLIFGNGNNSKKIELIKDLIQHEIANFCLIDKDDLD